jgi:hypothetical protein
MLMVVSLGLPALPISSSSPSDTSGMRASGRRERRTRALISVILAFLYGLASNVPSAAAQEAADPAGDHLEALPDASEAGAPIDEEAPDMLQKGGVEVQDPDRGAAGAAGSQAPPRVRRIAHPA